MMRALVRVLVVDHSPRTIYSHTDPRLVYLFRSDIPLLDLDLYEIDL